jgi:hypothetical protein
MKRQWSHGDTFPKNDLLRACNGGFTYTGVSASVTRAFRCGLTGHSVRWHDNEAATGQTESDRIALFDATPEPDAR